MIDMGRFISAQNIMPMNDGFSKLHPLLHALFFSSVIVFVLVVNDPFFVAVSLVSALLYGFRTRGRRMFRSLVGGIVTVVAVGVFNMLFAHYGVTVLFALGDTEFTLESLFYGLYQGMVLCSSLLWFGALSRLFDSDRVVYLFRFTPRIALVFSMVLGFIPRFTRKLDDIRDAQLALNGGKPTEKRLRQALNNLSTLVSYSLESSIITADSMTARGYDPHAIHSRRYRLSPLDVVLFVIIISALVACVVEKSNGNILFVFDPAISVRSFSVVAIVAFSILSMLPFIVDLSEDILWKVSNVKN